MIQSAVERQLEILGEAAGRVSEVFRQTHPVIDWRKTVGLRNIIVHRYDEIQQDIIWNIIVTELANLLAQLEPLLPPLTDEQLHCVISCCSGSPSSQFLVQIKCNWAYVLCNGRVIIRSKSTIF